MAILAFGKFPSLEGLFLALAAKTSVRVRGVPVLIIIVSAAIPLAHMIPFQTKQVHWGADMGGVNNGEGILNEAPVPGLFPHTLYFRDGIGYTLDQVYQAHKHWLVKPAELGLSLPLVPVSSSVHVFSIGQ